ncbi:hypothetical protein BY458DRAFT_517236 [Sporodiniella umbellata]|nr:hypothetical protein BY458DRAFT_517236 [Sporodiniella umbellata]
MYMKIYGSFAIFLQVLVVYAAAQIVRNPQATADFTISIPSNIPASDATVAIPTSVNVATVPIRFHHTVVSVNDSFSSSYSPSPTAFVFTYYPTHTAGLNTSAVSSMLPSQSAPLPDDTVGKNGRLRIASLSCQLYISWFAVISLSLVTLLNF